MTVNCSSACFDSLSTVCHIIFANFSSIKSIATVLSQNSVTCLVQSSLVGRIVNISLSGLLNLSIPFIQYEDYVFPSSQWDSGLDSFRINSTSMLPTVPEFECHELFSASSLSLLGDKPSCSMANYSISVSIGFGCSLTFQRLALAPTKQFFFKLGVTAIFSTLLPNMTVAQPVPVPSAIVDGPTSFGSCSIISVKMSVSTPAKVIRQSGL